MSAVAEVEGPDRPGDVEGQIGPTVGSIRSGLLLTAIAWFLTRLAVGVNWGPARNLFSFEPLMWKHWDSFAYLSMAAHGRTFGKCGSSGFPQTPFTLYTHEVWCGTAGWLPGYPWMITAAHWIGISLLDSAVIVSWAATFVAIFLVWWGWARRLSAGRALAVLLLFGLFPGAVYNFGIFPTSTGLAFLVGALIAATRGRLAFGALLLTLAGLCYPTAWFAAVGIAAGLVLSGFRLGTSEIVKRALWGIAGLSSLAILAILDQVSFRRAGAFFLDDQQAIGSVTSVGEYFKQLFITRNDIQQVRMGAHAAPLLSAQVAIAFALSFAGALAAALRWHQKKWAFAQIYPAFASISIVVALALTDTSTWNRSVVLAAPCVVCLRRLPIPLLWCLVGIVGVTTALISRSFFNNAFV